MFDIDWLLHSGSIVLLAGFLCALIMWLRKLIIEYPVGSDYKEEEGK